MDNIRLEKLARWIEEIPGEAFLEAATTRPPGLAKDFRFSELQSEIRALIPVPGDEWVHDIDVLIQPGQSNHQGQRWHSHSEWTAIYYVAVGDPVVPLRVRDQRAELEISPVPGDCVILPPNTEHRVANSRSDTYRLSFAMLVPPPGEVSKYARV